jgi:hypothetical protein
MYVCTFVCMYVVLADDDDQEPSLSLIVHPSTRALGSPAAPRALWRKREVRVTYHVTSLDMTYIHTYYL